VSAPAPAAPGISVVSADASAETTDVVARAEAVGEALAAAGQRLPEPAVRQASGLLAKVGERVRLSGRYTVVALAGATGSGKSSLFNAIAGIEIATVGARRPTTSAVTACIWGGAGAQQLLDWLGVPSRHRIRHESPLDAGDDRLSGLVLLDLPDHDSTEHAHRLEVDRLVELVDVFVWVSDPQKYADAALHRRYLTPLAGHDAVTVVVLNQVDRLPQIAAEACRRDLERLVRADGLRGIPVLSTSATVGTGVGELRDRLADAVGRRNAWHRRLAADLDASTRRLRGCVADVESVIGDGVTRTADDDAAGGLVDALAGAAGVPLVVRGVQDSFVRGAVGAAGWPLTRWARRFKPDPLLRLRLGATRREPGGASGTESDDEDLTDLAAAVRTARSSLPAPTAAQRSRVDLATRALADRAATGLPDPWADAVRAAAQPPSEDLGDALDQAVLATELPTSRPFWWSLIGGLQLVLAGSAGLGLVWLVALGVLGSLRLPSLPTPSLGAVPLPTALLLGGLSLGLLLGVLVRRLAVGIGQRRAAEAGRRLTGAVATVAGRHLIDPVRAVLTDHRRTREALDRAR
jgi:energy-coupling factor transporter ATP-binding protein EcfA2